MSKIIKVYCEGEQGSLDAFIINKLLPYPSILVEPVGGIKGAKSVVQALEKRAIEKTDFYMLFRDRDFDKPITGKPALEQMGSLYEYCSYRNTIENYLFNTKHFFEFLTTENILQKCAVQNEDDVKQLFIKAANRIKIYQAVRHTLGKMRSGEATFGTKLTAKSGILPERLDFNFCRTEALKVIQKAVYATSAWNEHKFDEILASFTKLFNDDFINQFNFLIYFQGKDFATALVQILYQTFPMKKYYRYARDQFEYTNFPDLIDLHNLLKSKYEGN